MVGLKLDNLVIGSSVWRVRITQCFALSNLNLHYAFAGFFDLADPFYVGSYPVPLVLYVTSGLFLYESGGTPL